MREIRLSGSVEGVVSNHDPYSDSLLPQGTVLIDIELRRRLEQLRRSRRTSTGPRQDRQRNRYVVRLGNPHF